MRILVILLTLMVGNIIGYTWWTRPAVEEREWLEVQCHELAERLEARGVQFARWRELERLVELAEPVLETFPSGDSKEFAGLRRVFLEAERGLALQRGSLNLRPDEKVPDGFRGVRIQATLLGSFAGLLTYVERTSRIQAPVTPVELALRENQKGQAPLLLTMTWLALLPEESDS